MPNIQYRICFQDPLLEDTALHRADCDQWQWHDLIASGDAIYQESAEMSGGTMSVQPAIGISEHRNCTKTYDGLLAAIEAAKASVNSYTPCHCCADEYLNLSAAYKRA